MQVQFPVRAHTEVAGMIPNPGTYREGANNLCFSLPSMFLSLPSSEKMSLGKDLKKGKEVFLIPRGEKDPYFQRQGDTKKIQISGPC